MRVTASKRFLSSLRSWFDRGASCEPVESLGAAGPSVAEFREAHSAQEDQAPSGGSGGELTNQERRELKKRFDAVTRKLEKTEGAPDRLRAALAEVEPTDYEKLVAAQTAVDDAVAAREALEDEWLELSDKLGIE